jgi:RNA polymerase sigma factor (sigma-70 family)
MSSDTREASVADPAWIREVLRRYEGPLLRYAAAMGGEERARDVVQDTFVRLCTRAPKGVEDRVAAWLFTVCKNRALELRRSDRRLTSIEEGDLPPNPDSGPAMKLEMKENVTRVGEAMAALPERYREALLLKVDAGLSYKEIAEVMDITIGHVGFILHDAIAEIRERLAKQEKEVSTARRETGRAL